MPFTAAAESLIASATAVLREPESSQRKQTGNAKTRISQPPSVIHILGGASLMAVSNQPPTASRERALKRTNRRKLPMRSHAAGSGAAIKFALAPDSTFTVTDPWGIVNSCE